MSFNHYPMQIHFQTIWCKIKFKNANKIIMSRSYSCPRKFCEAWQMLIEKNMDTGHIHLSLSPYSSPFFLIPKTDKTVLPHWVNDFCTLNMNMVSDCYPLPCIDDILADTDRGKIWSKLDMTDSFFHTRVDEASTPCTAVIIPFGLYEWLVMPCSIKNAPVIHQHHVNHTL